MNKILHLFLILNTSIFNSKSRESSYWLLLLARNDNNPLYDYRYTILRMGLVMRCFTWAFCRVNWLLITIAYPHRGVNFWSFQNVLWYFQRAWASGWPSHPTIAHIGWSVKHHLSCMKCNQVPRHVNWGNFVLVGNRTPQIKSLLSLFYSIMHQRTCF